MAGFQSPIVRALNQAYSYGKLYDDSFLGGTLTKTALPAAQELANLRQQVLTQAQQNGIFIPQKGPAPQAAFTAAPSTPIPPVPTNTSPTPAPVQQQPSAMTQTVKPIPVTDFVGQQIQSPTLPQGTSLVPELMQSQQGDFMNPAVAMLSPNTGATGLTPATATQVNPNSIPNIGVPAPQVQASTIGDTTPQATAAQGAVTSQATVQGQFKQLMDFEPGEVPQWAKGAVATAQDALASRGLGGSSIAAGTITAALSQAALPIASQDAQTYFQMDMANLQNEQQTKLTNLQAKQQSLLTDTAALNAAKQFNATNEMQVRQFQATLVAQIQEQNATRTTSISQFNSDQDAAVKKFNAEMLNQRQLFEAQSRFAIDQSNVLWRRSINTANTAAINAANQYNVTNRFNISQTALNNVWQQWRDTASWAFQSSENAANRSFNIAVAANNRQYADDVYRRDRANTMTAAIGAFAKALF